jgi:hypothetical protein
MADERDRLRARLGLAPLPAGRTDSAASVDERTQRAAMAAASATPAPISTEPKRYYNYYTGEYVDDPSKIKPRTGMGGPESGGGTIQVTADAGGKTVTSVTYEGTGKNRIKITKYSDGTETREAAPEEVGGGAPTIVSTYTDPNTGDVIAVYSDGTTKVLSQGTKAADAAKAKAEADAAAAKAAEEKRRTGQSAYTLLFEQFNQYGLGALVAPLEGFIVEGLSPAEFTLRLRDTDAYKKRFAANQARIQRGLRALSEAEYIGLEDQYQNVMRNYGLPASYYSRGDMGRQEGFEKFIGGDVSAAELEDRIITAQSRVLNAAPQVAQSLRQFYPEITGGDILAYALDPDKALNEIKRKVGAAEIGAGAAIAGLATGLSRAEELQRYGVTGEQARAGYQTIGEFLPRASQLGDIYAKQGLGPFTQTTAEEEVFGTTGAVEAGKKRRKLAQLEQAQFGGTSGAAQGALARERAGQY